MYLINVGNIFLLQDLWENGGQYIHWHLNISVKKTVLSWIAPYT